MHIMRSRRENIAQKVILRACWQKENEHGMHAARPWLRWFLTRVIGMKGIPTRESETKKRTRKQWLAVRKEAGLKIDPETAEVSCEHGSVRDPYGLYDLTDEEDNIGRNYFARSPGSVWVSFHDLPDAVRDRLWARFMARDFADDDLGSLFGDLDAGATDPAEAVSKE
jgi:hypothetical protein